METFSILFIQWKLFWTKTFLWLKVLGQRLSAPSLSSLTLITPQIALPHWIINLTVVNCNCIKTISLVASKRYHCLKTDPKNQLSSSSLLQASLIASGLSAWPPPSPPGSQTRICRSRSPLKQKGVEQISLTYISHLNNWSLPALYAKAVTVPKCPSRGDRGSPGCWSEFIENFVMPFNSPFCNWDWEL